MQDLKNKTIRAGVMNVSGRAVGFFLRIASLMILSRLLDPTDYGLVTMVTAFTGVLNMFGSFGLFQAAVQRSTLSAEQASTLFWLNLAFGTLMTLGAIALAPAVSAFYHEPRLFWVTNVIAIGFVITSAGVQHGALLQRQMRFGIFASIEIVSLMLATVVAVGMAEYGCGYWALVSMTVTLPLATTLGLWLTTGWIPNWPRREAGIRSMVRFGGIMTLNGFLSYFTNNIDKLLLGRFWGAEAIGVYGRAYHLVMFPTDNVNLTIGEVAFAALSRVADDRERLKRYFLKGYTLVVALTLPLTVACALFADDLIAVVLGPKWGAAAEIFRILAPTIMAFAILNPLGWLLNSLGLVQRGLKIALVSAPIMVTGILIGLPYGPKGVAIAYSTVMLLRVIPVAAWAVHGTSIHVSEIFLALVRPLIACLVAAGVVLAAHVYGPTLSLELRLLLNIGLFAAGYFGVMFCFSAQGSMYLDLLRAASAARS